MKIDNLKKIKPVWVIGGIIALFVIYGIVNNPDRKLSSVFDDYQNISESEIARKTELKNLQSQYAECFVPENADVVIFCLEGLPKIKALVSKESELLLSLQSLYDRSKKDLDVESRIFLENNIKLISSKEYQDVYKGTIDVLDAYVDFYVYLNGEYDTSKINDSMSQDEKIEILSHVIADRNFKRDLVVRNLTDLSGNLELKKEVLKRYVRANYSEDFTKAIGM